jgi:hypothetical protein
MSRLVASLFWTFAAIMQSITIPSQTVPLPAASLPPGMTYSPTAGLTVNGPITSNGMITGTQIFLTAGAAMPACASGLFLFSYNATTNTLSPACYTPVVTNQ